MTTTSLLKRCRSEPFRFRLRRARDLPIDSRRLRLVEASMSEDPMVSALSAASGVGIHAGGDVSSWQIVPAFVGKNGLPLAPLFDESDKLDDMQLQLVPLPSVSASTCGSACGQNLIPLMDVTPEEATHEHNLVPLMDDVSTAAQFQNLVPLMDDWPAGGDEAEVDPSAWIFDGHDASDLEVPLSSLALLALLDAPMRKSKSRRVL